MPAGAWTLFNSAILKDGDGTLGSLNGSTDYKISLHVAGGGAPARTCSTLADVTGTGSFNTEVANGAGGIYVTGGQAATPSEFIVHPSSAEKSRFNVPAVSWTTTGTSMAARYAVLRKATGNHVIAYCDLDTTAPGNITVAIGATLSITNTAGVFRRERTP